MKRKTYKDSFGNIRKNKHKNPIVEKKKIPNIVKRLSWTPPK